MLLGIVEHAGAETTFAAFVGKYIIVGAALTAFPKSFVGGQLGVSDRFISQIRVDLHYGHTGGDTENFSIGIFFAGELKNPGFNFSAKTQFAIVWMYNKPRIGDILLVLPAFDVAKAGQFSIIFVNSHNGFAFFHFGSDILGLAFGNTGTALFGCFFHNIANPFGMVQMLRVSYSYLNVHGWYKISIA